MNYDEAIKRLEQIVKELEKEEAISVEQYKTLAQEAQSLIALCRTRLTSLEEELKMEN